MSYSAIIYLDQAVDRFFASRKFGPTRADCDARARSLCGKDAELIPAPVQGATSYTVFGPRKHCGSGDEGVEVTDEGTTQWVISFREVAASLSTKIVAFAQLVHGKDIIPSIHGFRQKQSHNDLDMYWMNLVPGVALLDVMVMKVELSPEEKTKHLNLVRHLARYFARAYHKPQLEHNHLHSYYDVKRDFKACLNAASGLVKSIVPVETFDKVYSTTVDDIFTRRLVLTHRDLSLTNLLVDPETWNLTGIIDWSTATILPFGLELDILHLLTGYMDRSGWHFYSIRAQIHEVFWVEFGKAAGVDNGFVQNDLRPDVEMVMKIAVILRYGLQRDERGTPIPKVTTSEFMKSYLKAFLEETEEEVKDEEMED